MRCFIGIFPPKEIQQILGEVQKNIGREYAKIKWISPKQIHKTLKFLGEADEKEVELVKVALRNVKFKRFVVSLDKIGWFPSDEKIKIVWVGLKPEKEIMDLHGDIELKLGSLFAKDDRFAVHVTLGRVKFLKKKEEFLDRLRNVKVSWESFTVKDFSLVKSELSKDGPKYTVLERYTLK